MRYTAMLLGLCAILGLAACGGGHKTTLTSADGSTTVTTSADNKTVTAQTKDGTVSIGGTVAASKLGAPTYPGAASQGQDISASTSDGTTDVASFTTADDFGKVEAFYKAQLPAGSEKAVLTGDGDSFATFQIGSDTEKELIVVQVTRKKDDQTTAIQMSHLVKNGGADPTASPAGTASPAASPTSGAG